MFDPRTLWSRFGIFTIMIGFIIYLSIASPVFLTAQNFIDLGEQGSILACISLGMLVVMVTGCVDLTVGALLSLCGVVMAMAAVHMPLGLAIALGFVAAITAGLVTGFLSTRGHNLSVIVTLSMLTIIEGTALLMTGGMNITSLGSGIMWMGAENFPGGIPVDTICALVACLCVWGFLSLTPIGRELYAVGGNSEASRLLGIPVKRRILLAFVISACLAALAGLIFVGQVNSAQPTGGIGLELNAVAAVLIGGASLNGGAGHPVKIMIGVMILGLINNGINLLGVNAFYAYVVKGVVILVAILLDQWQRAGAAR
jgi:ribose transport system permease protein